MLLLVHLFLSNILSKQTHEDRVSCSCNNENKAVKSSKYKSSYKYKVPFKTEWQEQLNKIKAVAGDRYQYFCFLCNESASCQHKSIGNVKSHCKKPTHIRNLTSLKRKTSISFAASIPDWKNSNPEIMSTNFLVQHNLPIVTSDHLGPLFKQMFPDTTIASKLTREQT